MKGRSGLSQSLIIQYLGVREFEPLSLKDALSVTLWKTVTAFIAVNYYHYNNGSQQPFLWSASDMPGLV